jgi:hypothetical protein
MSYGSDVSNKNIFNLFSSKGHMLNLACYGGHLGFAIHTKNEILISVRDYPMTIQIYSSFNDFNPPLPKFTYGSM